MVTLTLLLVFGLVAIGVALWWVIERVEDVARAVQALYPKLDQRVALARPGPITVPPDRVVHEHLAQLTAALERLPVPHDPTAQIAAMRVLGDAITHLTEVVEHRDDQVLTRLTDVHHQIERLHGRLDVPAPTRRETSVTHHPSRGRAK